MSVASVPKAPSQIGQYRILSTIGVGGMGTVYLAEHLLLGRRAAVKTLHPSVAVHQQVVERFFNEARAMANVSDPGVAQIFDFGYAVDGTAYIVMELLEGESLSARIERLGLVSLAESLRIARAVAGSLDVAHELGIVHRDLKPENIFLVRDPEALGGARTKILDFGICKLGVGGSARVTQTGVVMGTPVYMSPEQCRDAAEIDQRSDVYSLGCVLFHMLAGRPPFDHESIGELLSAHLREEPRRPSLYVDLPAEVDALVLRCLAKSPDERFQSMGEVQAAIDEVLATLQVAANDVIDVPIATPARTEPTPNWFIEHTPPPPPPQPSRGFLRKAAIGVVALMAVAGVVAVTKQWIADDDPASGFRLPASGQSDPLAPATATAAAAPAPSPVRATDTAAVTATDTAAVTATDTAAGTATAAATDTAAGSATATDAAAGSATAAAPAPAPAAASDDLKLDQKGVDETAMEKQLEQSTPKPAAATKPAHDSPPPRHVSPPRRQPAAPASDDSTEDLYDTR